MDDDNILVLDGLAKLDLIEVAYTNKFDGLISLVTTFELHKMKQVLYRGGFFLSASASHVDKDLEIDDKALQLSLLTVQHEQNPVTFTTNVSTV